MRRPGIELELFGLERHCVTIECQLICSYPLLEFYLDGYGPPFYSIASALTSPRPV
jgi:hypothetical protein